MLLLDRKAYIANVGDSRAIMSSHGGERVTDLSRDHKPEDESEQNRIVNNGGQIY